MVSSKNDSRPHLGGMMIARRCLSRRTVLRGAGVAITLPLLDAMVPALGAARTAAAKPIRRIGFIYVPNGTAQNDIQNGVRMASGVNYWRPAGAGTDFELSPILAPLGGV